MKPKTIVIIYWVLTALFVLAMLGDAIGGIMHEKTGVENIQHLNYPVYIMTIMGYAKLLGAIAILQTKFVTIKEWAYAGFTISFIGAFWSRVIIGDGVPLLIPPVVFLVVMFITYFFWKKYLAIKAS